MIIILFLSFKKICNNKRFLETDQYFKISLLPEICKAPYMIVYIYMT